MTGIGDIADVPHLIPKVQEIPVDKVEGDERAGMPQMAFAADGWAAHVHAYMTRSKWGENFFLSCIRIMDFQ
jgi:hypothetical protein